MTLQILTLMLDGITAGDYLTWCRDPGPPALDFALRSISLDADPFGDTITATLDWNLPAPAPAAAAAAAGLALPAGIEIQAPMPTDGPHTNGDRRFGRGSPRPCRARATCGAVGCPAEH
jgi:hypothetical protein